MKIHIFVVLVISTGVAITMSLALVPGDRELALMFLKDKEFEEARNRYEVLWESGRRSSSVAGPLARLYLLFGQIEAAVRLMEEFVEENPENIEARVQLSSFYQYAQRPYSHVQNLDQIVSIRPSEPELRELSASFNFYGDYEKQIRVLKQLVNLFPRPQDFVDLARFQATRGMDEDALDTLERLEESFPLAVDDEIFELKLNLSLDLGHSRQAYDDAVRWLSREPAPEWFLKLAMLFRFKGEPQMAVQLLGIIEKEFHRLPEVLEEFIEIQIELDRKRLAFSRLQRLFLQGSLPPALENQVIHLGLDLSEWHVVRQVAEKSEINRLQEEAQVRLAEFSINPPRPEMVERLLQELDREFFEKYPILTAELKLASGDPDSARRWLNKAEKRSTLQQGQPYRLANLYFRLGRQRAAIDVSEKLLHQPGSDLSLLWDLTQAYLELGELHRGRLFFDALRRVRSEESCANAWALLAASSGESAPVIEWLEALPFERSDPDRLTDLYHVAVGRKLDRLAYICASRLKRLRGNRTDHFLLSASLTRLGRPQEALALLDSFVPEATDEKDVYAMALQAGWEQGLPIAEDWRDYWRENLQTHDARGSVSEQATYALLQVGDEEFLLPTLHRFARNDPEKWLHAYAEATRKVGRESELIVFLEEELERSDLDLSQKSIHMSLLHTRAGPARSLPFLRRFAEGPDAAWSHAYQAALESLLLHGELVDHLVARSQRSDLTADEKRAVAYRLLEYGRKRPAEGLFRDLAERADSTSSDAAQLFYLWGPRPSEESLLWLQDRVRFSSGVERIGWARSLLDFQAPERLLECLTGLDWDEARPQLVDLYLSAWRETDFETWTRKVAQGISMTRSPERLRAFARLTFEAGLEEQAREGYGKLSSIEGEDFEALKRLGQLAFSRGAYRASQRYLEDALSLQSDYETLFYLGEIALRENDPDGSAFYFRGALQELDATASPEDPSNALRVRALLLNRLGQLEASLALFEELLSQRPGDLNLTADMVVALLGNNRLDEARSILESTRARQMARSEDPSQSNPVTSGHLRAAGRVAHPSRPVRSAPLDVAILEQDGWTRLVLSSPQKLTWDGEISSRSVLLRFNGPVNLSRANSDLPRAFFLRQGWDSLLISSDMDTRFRIDRVDDTLVIDLRPQSSARSLTPLQLRKAQLALDLLRVELHQKTGDLPEVDRLLTQLEERYPGNPRLLTYRAALENRIERPRQALELSVRALEKHPDDEDILLFQEEILNGRRPEGGLETEYRTIQGERREMRLGMRGDAPVSHGLRLGGQMEWNDVDFDETVAESGPPTPRRQDFFRGRIDLKLETASDTRYEASFLLSRETGPGFGFSFLRPDIRGSTRISYEYRRAVWDSTAALLAGQSRNRLEFSRQHRLHRRLAALVSGSYNRYLAEGLPSQTSIAGGASFQYELPSRVLFLEYGLDAEYFLSEEDLTIASGPVFQASREVHSAALNFRKSFSETVLGEAFGGYSLDRLGGSGYFFGGNLQFSISNRFTGRLWSERRPFSIDTNRNETRFGLALDWKF